MPIILQFLGLDYLGKLGDCLTLLAVRWSALFPAARKFYLIIFEDVIDQQFPEMYLILYG
jgi:hypothetical protein